MLSFEGQSKEMQTKDFTVVIDAGHGGKDIGATDNGVKEKDINLQVAKYLSQLIKKKLKNTKVVMTRENDTYLTLQQRADKANSAHADIFVSIHTNSVDKSNKNRKSVSGSSVYTLGLHKDENNLSVARRENSVIELEKDYEQKYMGFDPQKDESYIIFEMAQKKNLSQSIRIADDIQKELVKSGRQDRGVHQAGFWVLWATSMPSVLVELDFICNPESAKYISSEKGAKELAEAIFKAIERYEGAWRKNFTGTANVNPEKEDNYVEEIYETSAISRNLTKQKKVKTQSATISTQGKNVGRKRRSSKSKAMSEASSYEAESIVYRSEQPVLAIAEPGYVAEPQTVEIKSSNKKNTKKEKTDKKRKEGEEKTAKKKETLDRYENTKKSSSHSARVNKLITVYKIQVLASADLLNQDNSRFCGLSPITAYKENNLYKYYYGESTDLKSIESMLADVRKKIPDAFIVTSQKSVKTTN